MTPSSYTSLNFYKGRPFYCNLIGSQKKRTRRHKSENQNLIDSQDHGATCFMGFYSGNFSFRFKTIFLFVKRMGSLAKMNRACALASVFSSHLLLGLSLFLWNCWSWVVTDTRRWTFTWAWATVNEVHLLRVLNHPERRGDNHSDTPVLPVDHHSVSPLLHVLLCWVALVRSWKVGEPALQESSYHVGIWPPLMLAGLFSFSCSSFQENMRMLGKSSKILTYVGPSLSSKHPNSLEKSL